MLGWTCVIGVGKGSTTRAGETIYWADVGSRDHLANKPRFQDSLSTVCGCDPVKFYRMVGLKQELNCSVCF